jgi:pimeloyl-ACP methyl ester carboxylesterase
VPAFVPQAMQAESTAHPIWDDISGLTCPVLLMRGSGDGSLLTDEDADAYKAALPHAEEVIFEGSDHELWRPDYDRFMDAIREFLARIDKNGRVT